MAYESVNPDNGETAKTFPDLSDEQFEEKIKLAAKTYQLWKKMSYARRAQIVARAGDIMNANVDVFAKQATIEMGKLINEAPGEVRCSADILAYYAKNGERFLAPGEVTPSVRQSTYGEQPNGGDLLC